MNNYNIKRCSDGEQYISSNLQNKVILISLIVIAVCLVLLLVNQLFKYTNNLNRI